MDLEMWQKFLMNQSAFCRPFIDFQDSWNAVKLNFYTDSAKSAKLGCGGICGRSWFSRQWSTGLIEDLDPSIEYLELYAVTVGVLLWIKRFPNRRVILFCDNKSCVDMINLTSSRCKNCLVLLRIIVLEAMTWNVRIFCRHVKGKNNKLEDFLSRLRIDLFRKEIKKSKLPKVEKFSTEIPDEIWPVNKIWID